MSYFDVKLHFTLLSLNPLVLTQDAINFIFTTPISRAKTVKEEGKNEVAYLENSWLQQPYIIYVSQNQLLL